MIGIAMGSTSSDGVLIRGMYRANIFLTLTKGVPAYIGGTAGELTNTVPSGTGTIVRIVGYAIGNNTLYLQPDATYVERS